MPYVLNKPLRGRFISLPGGRKKFGYVCGKSICDTNALKERMFIDPFFDPFPIVPTVFQARFIRLNPVTGKRQYAICSECHDQPTSFPDVNFVLTDVWPPYGVTDVIKFFFILGDFPVAVRCLQQDEGCPYIYLHYGGGRTWTGSFATDGGALTVSLELTDDQDADRPLIDGWPDVRKWQVTFGGCQDPPKVLHAHVGCYYPFQGGGQYAGPLPADCCPDSDSPPSADVGFGFRGFTNRLRPARFVGLPNGKKLFHASRCCEPDVDCDVTVCCGCDVAPFQWTVTVAGVVNGPGPPFAGTHCECHNGSWTLSLSDDGSRPDCTWSSQPTTCDPQIVMWRLRCDNTAGKWYLASQYTLGGGGTATYSRPIADWDCLGSNVMTLDSAPPAICTGWPGSVTVDAVAP